MIDFITTLVLVVACSSAYKRSSVGIKIVRDSFRHPYAVLHPLSAMSASFRIKSALWDKIHYFASFPQTGVSLQQMVLFGQNPSQGTLLRASQFLAGPGLVALSPARVLTLPAEELPVRLAHRVKELDELPHNLSEMPSIKKVKNWYAQSFEVRLFSIPSLSFFAQDLLF